jgi:IS5 family transposase
VGERPTIIVTEDARMIADFDDFCLYVYYTVDTILVQLAPQLRRPGPAPTTLSDSELIALALIAECCGWDLETDLLAQAHVYRHLFPRLPDQSRFNRRRRALARVINAIRGVLLQGLDLAYDRQCAIDSLPVPVVQFHHAPQASDDWKLHEASIGYVASKQQWIYGYKLHLLVTLGGVILDFVLAPAHAGDLPVGAALLAEHTALTVFGDKGYVSAAVAAELQAQGVRLIAQRRQNQRQQLPAAMQRLMTAVRQIVETVNGQLAAQFNVERNHAHTFGGLRARLYTKLTAHTLCIYLNRWLGNPDWLQIKQLAFPI